MQGAKRRLSQVGFDHDLEEVMTSMSFNPADKGENRAAMERFLDDVGWAVLLITVGLYGWPPRGSCLMERG